MRVNPHHLANGVPLLFENLNIIIFNWKLIKSNSHCYEGHVHRRRLKVGLPGSYRKEMFPNKPWALPEDHIMVFLAAKLHEKELLAQVNDVHPPCRFLERIELSLNVVKSH